VDDQARANAGPSAQIPLANRIGSITAMVIGGVFVTCVAPRLFPARASALSG
jgi:hypothetical protein